MKRGLSLSGLISVIQLFIIFKREKFDLVQYCTANAGCYASIAAKLADIPVRLYCQWGVGYVHMTGIKSYFKKLLEKTICHNSTHIQPDSKENLQIALREKLYSKEQGAVIWNGSACGIDLERFDISNREQWRKEIRTRFHIRQDSFVIGYVGRMLKDKGLNELFQAFQMLDEEFGNITLLIVGDNSSQEGINSDLWNYAINNRHVIFTGKTNTPEKYYAAFDCFTLPSYHEGFGMVTIEAEAMGLPIVDTNIPGSREAMVDKQTGILVAVKDSNSLYQGLKTIYENPALARFYAQNSVEFVSKNFDQKILLEKIYINRLDLLTK